jgi:hypothetical protein
MSTHDKHVPGLTHLPGIADRIKDQRGKQDAAAFGFYVFLYQHESIDVEAALRGCTPSAARPFGYFDTTEKKLYPTKAAAELMGCIESELIPLFTASAIRTTHQWQKMPEDYTPSEHGHRIWPDAEPFTIAVLGTNQRWYTLAVVPEAIGASTDSSVKP